MGLVMVVEADKVANFREELHSLIDEPWFPAKGASTSKLMAFYFFFFDMYAMICAIL